MLNGIERQARNALGVYRLYGPAELFNRMTDRVRLALGVPRAEHRAYLARKLAEDAAFDGPGGTDTGGIQHLNELTIESANARWGTTHIAISPSEFAQLMPLAERDLGDVDQATFVDLGSGKGRALMLAADRGFGHVVGVEFAAELDAAARENIASRPDRGRFTLIHGDAADYELPAGPVVVYLANPFDTPVMAEVVRRATASWQAARRPIRIVYYNPICGAEWLNAGWREAGWVPGCIVYAPD